MNTLRETRKKRNLTQVELSERSGIDQTTISGLEVSQDRIPSWPTVARLAKALNVRPDALFPVEGF